MVRQYRSLRALLALAAVAALPVSALAAGRLAHQVTGTSIHLYSPFNGGGAARIVRVAKAARGYCWTTSSTDSRSDAFRCFVGNFIHDPCFSNETVTTAYVLCPLYTPVSKVLRIVLTKPLPGSGRAGDPTRYPPWALRLSNRVWCEILSGATGLIAGMRIIIGCRDGGTLLGNPQRSSSTWTIFYTPKGATTEYHSVNISEAWW